MFLQRSLCVLITYEIDCVLVTMSQRTSTVAATNSMMVDYYEKQALFSFLKTLRYQSMFFVVFFVFLKAFHVEISISVL